MMACIFGLTVFYSNGVGAPPGCDIGATLGTGINFLLKYIFAFSAMLHQKQIIILFKSMRMDVISLVLNVQFQSVRFSLLCSLSY